MFSKSFAREILSVHLFQSRSDSKQWFRQSFSVFQNICPAISIQLLVCNLQLFTAGNASRPGVWHAIECCWESCSSPPGSLLSPEEEEFVSKVAQPCQVTHWQEQGVNTTWPDSPARELQKSGPGRRRLLFHSCKCSPNAGTSQISNPEGSIGSFLYKRGHSIFWLNIFG